MDGACLPECPAEKEGSGCTQSTILNTYYKHRAYLTVVNTVILAITQHVELYLIIYDCMHPQ